MAHALSTREDGALRHSKRLASVMRVKAMKRNARRKSRTNPRLEWWWKEMIKMFRAAIVALYGDIATAVLVAATQDVLRVVRLAAREFERDHGDAERTARPPGPRVGTNLRSAKRLFREIKLNARKSAWRDDDWFARQLARQLGGLPSSLPRRTSGFKPVAVRSPENCVFSILRRRIFVFEMGSGNAPFYKYVHSSSQGKHALSDRVVVITCDKDPSRKAYCQKDYIYYRSWMPAFLEQVRRDYPDFQGFDYVHWSPECTELSAAKTTADRDLDTALHMVQSGLSLVTYLNPRVWTIECSSAGPHALHLQACMRALGHFRLGGADAPASCTFCKNGGRQGIMKPGSWWTNIPGRYLEELRRSLCCAGNQCIWSLLFGEHGATAQSGPDANGKTGTPRDKAMEFPELLVERWLTAAVQWIWDCEPDAVVPRGAVCPDETVAWELIAEAAAAVLAAHSTSALPMTVSESSQGSVQRRSPYGVLRELGSDVYEFERVLRRRKRGGIEESLIQWRGMGKKYASWEPSSNVVPG